MKKSGKKEVLGWREWVSLPELGIQDIKAKVDTGARTSALHAFDLRYDEVDGVRKVHFKIHPFQDNSETVIECHANVVDERDVTDSGGHKERRLIIQTILAIGEKNFLSKSR